MTFHKIIKQILFLIVSAIIIGVSFNFIRPNSIPLIAKELPIVYQLPINRGESVLIGITTERARLLHENGIVFVDAREPEYYHEGHIAGAWNISSPLELAFKLDSLQGKTGPIVTYCGEADCGSSEDMAYTLQEMGFTKLYIYKSGWLDWVKAGLPVE